MLALVAIAVEALKGRQRVIVGSTWTTDAPFRETAEAIEAARSKGVLAVEMEAAALYSFARARGGADPLPRARHQHDGPVRGDFEKGEADGAADALAVLEAIVRRVTNEQV